MAGGINTYGYVEGNPLSFIDPLGLQLNDPLLDPGGYARRLSSGSRMAMSGVGGGGVGRGSARPSAQPVNCPPLQLPQDRRVNPDPPAPLSLERAIGRSATQNQRMQDDLAAARQAGATDIRVNQQQVNAAGDRVGINRPDLQYTNSSGQRVYVEYDRLSSTRGPAHERRLMANDPNGTVILVPQN